MEELADVAVAAEEMEGVAQHDEDGTATVTNDGAPPASKKVYRTKVQVLSDQKASIERNLATWEGKLLILDGKTAKTKRDKEAREAVAKRIEKYKSDLQKTVAELSSAVAKQAAEEKEKAAKAEAKLLKEEFAKAMSDEGAVALVEDRCKLDHKFTNQSDTNDKRSSPRR